MFSVLVYLTFTLFFGLRQARISKPILTIYVIRRVFAQGSAFWGLVHTGAHFGG